MSRTADHAQRRSQIIDALLTTAMEAGLASVTIARVARSAQVSVGLVQHYFDSKDTLVQLSYDTCLDRIGVRIEAIIEHGEHNRSAIREMVVEALGQLLPLDETRTAECRLRQEFLGLSTRNPQLAEAARLRDHELVLRLTTAIENGKECGEVAPGLDAPASAVSLLTLCHGIAARSLFTGTGDSEPLGSAIAAVFTGKCDRTSAPI